MKKPSMDAIMKFVWIALRGALYTAISGVSIYVANFHPTSGDVPLFVGIAFFVEALVAAGGKWLQNEGQPALGAIVTAAAPTIGQDVLSHLDPKSDTVLPVVPPVPPMTS